MNKKIEDHEQERQKDIEDIIGFIFNNNMTKVVKIKDITLSYTDYMGISREQKINVETVLQQYEAEQVVDSVVEEEKKEEQQPVVEHVVQYDKEISVPDAIVSDLPEPKMTFSEETEINPHSIEPNVNNLKGPQQRKSILQKLANSLKR